MGLSWVGIILSGATGLKKTIHTRAQSIFCEMLRAERKRIGLTQVELSKRLGRPQSFVAKVERGERRLDVVEFCRYSLTIGFRPEQFLKRFLQDDPLRD